MVAVAGITRRELPPGLSLPVPLPGAVLSAVLFHDDNFSASPDPRETRAMRTRPSFEVARTRLGTAHLCTRGQAGRAEVRTFCGLTLRDATVEREVDVWIACDTCRRLRFTAQRWVIA